MKRKRYLILTARVLLSLLIGAMVLEGAAQFLAYRVYKLGRLFESDSVLGWRCIPDLNLERKNANGQPWTIRINKQGFRTAPDWVRPSNTHILIIGDSLAFGEGVNLNDRFDTIIHRDRPSLEFKNIAIMGFGTDQELLAARRYGNDLRKGDVILLVTGYNDFFDVQRHSFAGRPKPWFELHDGQIREHQPDLSLISDLRNRSYVVARLYSAIEREPALGPAQLGIGIGLYRAMVRQEAEKWNRKGVTFLIATYFSADLLTVPGVEGMISNLYTDLCAASSLQCFDLSGPVRSGGSGAVLNDGHWNPQGHRIVAQSLLASLAQSEH